MREDDAMMTDPPAPEEVAMATGEAVPLDPVALYAHQWKRRVPLLLWSSLAVLWLLVLAINVSERRIHRQRLALEAELERRGYVDGNRSLAEADPEWEQELAGWKKLASGPQPFVALQDQHLGFLSEWKTSSLDAAGRAVITAAVVQYEKVQAKIATLESHATLGSSDERFYTATGWIQQTSGDRYRTLIVKEGDLDRVDRHLEVLDHLARHFEQVEQSEIAWQKARSIRRQQLGFLVEVMNAHRDRLDAARLRRWARWTTPVPITVADIGLTRQWLQGALRVHANRDRPDRSGEPPFARLDALWFPGLDLEAALSQLDRGMEAIKTALADPLPPELQGGWWQGDRLWESAGGLVLRLQKTEREYLNYAQSVDIARRALLYRLEHGELPQTIDALGEEVASMRDPMAPDGGRYRVVNTIPGTWSVQSHYAKTELRSLQEAIVLPAPEDRVLPKTPAGVAP